MVQAHAIGHSRERGRSVHSAGIDDLLCPLDRFLGIEKFIRRVELTELFLRSEGLYIRATGRG
jgi:hypothetical protein